MHFSEKDFPKKFIKLELPQAIPVLDWSISKNLLI
jgi:hypothetical protein